MKKPSSILEYPIVIRKVLNFLTISSPDLSIFKSIPLPEKRISNNRYVTQFNDQYALSLGRAVIEIWKDVDRHIQTKKWAPAASHIKHTVTKSQKALSVPAFKKLVAMTVDVSEDTIRRDVDDKRIKSYKTRGGHRRIPASELGPYLELLKDKKTDPLLDLRRSMKKMKIK
jgi:excisionase family DNA binding protein